MADWEVFDIQVALKIIKHISGGIYRTPGGIIKELVNNSYDAGARTVRIKTNHPEYNNISIKDDGDGMTKDSFEFSFMHVGASQKALEPDQEAPYGRKIIGMFGIGMLAAVHASQNIVMRTFPKDQTYGLEAELNLAPYFEYVNQIKTLEEFKFGTIKYKEIERGPNDVGTEITLNDIDKKSNFYKAISRTAKNRKEYVKWPSNTYSEEDDGTIMDLFVANMDKDGVRSVEDLCGREQFLWELGLICPVEYFDDGPIKEEYLDEDSKTVIENIKGELKSLNFKVYFDGVQLRKPIRLPSTKLRTSDIDEMDLDSDQDFKVTPITINKTLPDSADGTSVVATGYVIHQPHRISPLQLMGFYPRVKYVGVGRYDNNFFRVIHGEQPILRAQLSGELYIRDGLDEALNLDREGFIEIDSGYQVLKEELRYIIQESKDSVIKKAKKSSNARRERRLELKEQEQRKNIEEEVSKTLSQLMPDKQVAFKEPDEDENENNTREYSSLGIKTGEERIEVSISDLRIDDPRTVSLIITMDEMLSSKPEFVELREEFRRIVNELFKEL